MDLEPETENGKRLSALLLDWNIKFPDRAMDFSKRVFLMYASKLVNDDAFIAALYGQRVVDEPPLEMRQHLTTNLLRIHHAVGISLSKGCIKELVVALERTENENILAEILKLATKEAKNNESGEGIKPPSVDLAPQRADKTFSSLLLRQNPTSMEPRVRKICWEDGKSLYVLQVCGSRIICGFQDGQVRVYSYPGLQCEAVLWSFSSECLVMCLECTCTEIIAGYADRNIRIWNIQSGLLIQEFSVGGSGNSMSVSGRHASCMKWKAPKLLVGTVDGRVSAWQYANSSVLFLGERPFYNGRIKSLEFDDDHVILLHSSMLNIHNSGGGQLRTIEIQGPARAVVLDRSCFVINGDDKRLRIWNAKTGKCLKELEGHEDGIVCVDAKNNVILSGDETGQIIIWNLDAALIESRPITTLRFQAPDFSKQRYDYSLRLGEKFIAVSQAGSTEISVIDYP